MDGQERGDNPPNSETRAEPRGEPCATIRINNNGRPRVITNDGTDITDQITWDWSDYDIDLSYGARNANSILRNANTEPDADQPGPGDQPGPARPRARRVTTHSPSGAQYPHEHMVQPRAVLPPLRTTPPSTPPAQRAVNLTLADLDGSAVYFTTREPYDPPMPRDEANRLRRLRYRNMRIEYELLQGQLGIARPSPRVIEWIRHDILRCIGYIIISPDDTE